MPWKLRIYGATLLCAFAIACSDDDEVNGQPDDAGVSDAGVSDAGVSDADVGDADLEDTGEDDADTLPSECPLEFRDSGRARIFTFGSTIGVEDAVNYESYEDYFRGQVREIADCMSDERPNILLFPEDAGLHAGLIGSRGAGARDASDAEQAFLQLMLAYNDGPISHIGERFGELDTPRLIFLGLTDTLWRAMDQTFSTIADDYDAWVLTSGNVAEVEETTDTEMIEIWADPDLEDLESVFVPVDEEVYNSALIYNPDGQLVERIHKPYLTETEEVELALSYGPVDDLRPVDVGPERFGVFTSKDAWMPPLNDRLGLLGSTVQVQPEAFSGWTITQLDDQEEWLPDVLTQSGWAAVQKYPSYLYGAMPVLTGNFVGMSFDGQAVVWGQAHPGVDFGGFVGQQERPGFLEVGPWAFNDPGDEDPDLSLEERRQQLRELGEALLPGAGEPHENAYVDSVVGHDLRAGLEYMEDETTKRHEAVDAITIADPEDFDGGIAQRLRVDAADDLLALTWQGDRSGSNDGDAVRLVAMQWDDETGEYGEFLIDARTMGGEDDSDGIPIAPVVHIDEHGEVFKANTSANSDASMMPLLDRYTVEDENAHDVRGILLPDGSRDIWLPDLAADGDRMALVYTDGATGHDRVYLSLSENGGEDFQEALAVDDTADVDPPNTRGNQWHPTVDINGETIVVVWTDFRDFQWDLYGTFSVDGGETWTDARRIDGAGDGYERLHTDPRVVLVDEDEAIVSWTYQADRRPDTDARYRRWDLGDDSFEDSVALDRQSQTYATHSWLPRVKPVGEDAEVAAAWMELRDETSVIVANIPGFDEPIEVSHPGRIAWWPDLAVAGDRVIVTWVEHRPDEGFAIKLAHFDGQ